MEVPPSPCALNSALAASSRIERMRWPALRVARALWRGVRKPFRSGVPLAALSARLVNRWLPDESGSSDLFVCYTNKWKGMQGEGAALTRANSTGRRLAVARAPDG